jgi:hypothetical protein
MVVIGGKKKVNKSLKAWVAFVKKVQKEEKLNYKDAIHRAKQRKDKGEKWMHGGNYPEEKENNETILNNTDKLEEGDDEIHNIDELPKTTIIPLRRQLGYIAESSNSVGGKKSKRRRTRGRTMGMGKGRTMGMGKGRTMGMGKGRTMGMGKGRTMGMGKTRGKGRSMGMGMGMGMGRSMGMGMGRSMGMGMGRERE